MPFFTPKILDLEFRFKPRELEENTYVPDPVEVIFRPSEFENFLLIGASVVLLGDTALKMALAQLRFRFQKETALKLVHMGFAEETGRKLTVPFGNRNHLALPFRVDTDDLRDKTKIEQPVDMTFTGHHIGTILFEKEPAIHLGQSGLSLAVHGFTCEITKVKAEILEKKGIVMPTKRIGSHAFI